VLPGLSYWLKGRIPGTACSRRLLVSLLAGELELEKEGEDEDVRNQLD